MKDLKEIKKRMTSNQLNKAETKWKKMLDDPEKSHNYAKNKGIEGNICEYLACKILNYPINKFFDEIKEKPIPKNGYYKINRGGKRKKESKRGENLNCIKLAKKYPKLIIDREVPTKTRSKENLDLLIDYKNELIFGEAKIQKSTETILRAAIEIERYYRFINHKELFEELNNALNKKYSKISKAIIVYKFEYKKNRKGERTELLYTQLTSGNYICSQKILKRLKIYVIDADELDKGNIVFIEGYSPNDY